MFGLFFGMIVGSFYVIYYQLERITLKSFVGISIGITIGLIISFADNFEVADSNLIIFFSGMIAISGMILPGLSGSYLLLLMGNYTLIMVDSVNALYFTLIELFSFYGLCYAFFVIGCSQMSVMFNSRVLSVPYSVKML